ncbi:MAG: peptide chain release factor N(5)-glutamine methyltransferase, partial [Verrucomicrobiota bacterium]
NSERTELSREVQQDPSLALYGGETGTEIVEKALEEALAHLEGGGLLALELGIDQSSSMKVLAEDLGYFPVETRTDLNGIDRFLFATKPA